jgi:hypothetical protein
VVQVPHAWPRSEAGKPVNPARLLFAVIGCLVVALDFPSWVVWRFSGSDQPFGYRSKMREIWWLLAQSESLPTKGSTLRVIGVGLYLAVIVVLVLLLVVWPVLPH